MSWSVNLIGTPEGVVKELDAIGEAQAEGQSKIEFMAAKPYLQGLVSEIVGQTVKLEANGHATFTDGKKTYGNIYVVLKSEHTKWCG